MNINTAFPSKYLKASDLGEAQPVVTISRVEIEPVGQGRDMKPILYFQGKEKGLVLNKTNSRKVAALAGSFETDEWVGTQIKLYATEVEFQGETVEAIRIKELKSVKPAPKVKREPGEDDVDDVGF